MGRASMQWRRPRRPRRPRLLLAPAVLAAALAAQQLGLAAGADGNGSGNGTNGSNATDAVSNAPEVVPEPEPAEDGSASWDGPETVQLERMLCDPFFVPNPASDDPPVCNGKNHCPACCPGAPHYAPGLGTCWECPGPACPRVRPDSSFAGPKCECPELAPDRVPDPVPGIIICSIGLVLAGLCFYGFKKKQKANYAALELAEEKRREDMRHRKKVFEKYDWDNSGYLCRKELV
eukprot:SAG22_NODE_5556_length_993_cov_2.180089_1_plen_233_part_10